MGKILAILNGQQKKSLRHGSGQVRRHQSQTTVDKLPRPIYDEAYLIMWANKVTRAQPYINFWALLS